MVAEMVVMVVVEMVEVVEVVVGPAAAAVPAVPPAARLASFERNLLGDHDSRPRTNTSS